VNALLRLLEYARPYRARLALAVAAMIVYGVGSGGVVLQVRPILDEVLPSKARLSQTIGAILVLYFVKGLGAYLSSYLMTDVGQRVVRDLRNVLFGTCSGSRPRSSPRRRRGGCCRAS
jgi:subfamily B ATP-binding cassette protein MsbA